MERVRGGGGEGLLEFNRVSILLFRSLSDATSIDILEEYIHEILWRGCYFEECC